MDRLRCEARGRTLALVLLALVVYGGSLWGRELLPPDEPRFALIGLEMARSGDGVVTRNLEGEIYLDKPPLLFWGLAMGFRLFGESEIPARIPSLLATLALVALIHRMGRRLFDETTGTAAALIYLSSVLALSRGAWCATDALLACGVFGALASLWRAKADDSRLAAVLAAAWLAMALLAKGPVALLFLLFAILADKITQARMFSARMLLRPLPIVTFGLIVLPPTLLLLSRVPPDTVFAALWHHSVERAISSWDNLEPWWYHPLALFQGFFPWSVLFLPAFMPRVLRVLVEDRRLRALGLFLLVVLVFFSLPAGKRGVYLLPAYPLLALLAARAWPEIAAWPAGRRISGGLAIGLALLFAAAGAAVLWPGEAALLIPPPISNLPAVRAGAGVLLFSFAGSMLVLPALLRSRPRAALIAAPVIFAALSGLAWPFWLTPALNQAQGARIAAREARAAAPPSATVAFTRGKRELLAWYTGWRGPILDTPKEVTSFLEGAGTRVIIGKRSELGNPRDWPRGSRIVWRGRLGRAELALLAYEGPPGSVSGPMARREGGETTP